MLGARRTPVLAIILASYLMIVITLIVQPRNATAPQIAG